MDLGASKGIAIISATGSGTWQYSSDGVTWVGFGNVSATSALLVSSTAHVRYLPGANSSETATFGFVGWDQTTGVASTNLSPSYANPSSAGGTTAYSTQMASASVAIYVTSVTDPPAAVIPIGYGGPQLPQTSEPIVTLPTTSDLPTVTEAPNMQLTLSARANSDLGARVSGKAPSDQAPRREKLGMGSPAPPIQPVVPAAVPPASSVSTELAIKKSDLELSNINSSALLEELSEAAGSFMHLSLPEVVSGSGLALTAGFVGWTLRGGALVSALLSSMPVWKGFDPLTVVVQPNWTDRKRQPISRAERMFDDISGAKSPAEEASL